MPFPDLTTDTQLFFFVFTSNFYRPANLTISLLLVKKIFFWSQIYCVIGFSFALNSSANNAEEMHGILSCHKGQAKPLKIFILLLQCLKWGEAIGIIQKRANFRRFLFHSDVCYFFYEFWRKKIETQSWVCLWLWLFFVTKRACTSRHIETCSKIFLRLT